MAVRSDDHQCTSLVAMDEDPRGSNAARDQGSHGSPLSTYMDHNLWPDLPEVLLYTVLRYLPAESIFKFRSVNKKWRELLTSPEFLGARFGAPHETPFCVLSDVPNERVAVYNIASDNWYYPPYDNFFCGPFSVEKTILMAAAAGLVLLEVLREPWQRQDDSWFPDHRAKRLLLLNPVNQSYRELPNLEDYNSDDGEYVWCPKVVGIDFDPETGSYQILARSTRFQLGRLYMGRLQRVQRVRRVRPGRSQFHVYDLKANSWEMIFDSRLTGGPEDWDKSYRVLDPAVLHGGFWYYLTYAHRFWGPSMRDATPHVFRVKRGVAEAVEAPMPHEVGMIIDFLHLFVCKGKLILAGSVKTIDNRILNEWMSFRFWQLDEQGSAWLDFLNMPAYLVNYLGDRSVKRFALDLECSVDGDYICFWVGRPAGMHYRSIEIIMYSIAKDSWWTVNSEVNMPRTAGGNYGHGYIRRLYNKSFAYFLFKPNLNITL